MSAESKPKSVWTSLPAILAGIAAVLGAIAAIITAFLPGGIPGLLDRLATNNPAPPLQSTPHTPVAVVTSTLNMKRLEVIFDPPEAADFVLNPIPDSQGEFEAGTVVTIHVSPKSGWEVQQWIGPLLATTSNTAKINMSSDQSVIVKLALIPSN